MIILNAGPTYVAVAGILLNRLPTCWVLLVMLSNAGHNYVAGGSPTHALPPTYLGAAAGGLHVGGAPLCRSSSTALAGGGWGALGVVHIEHGVVGYVVPEAGLVDLHGVGRRVKRWVGGGGGGGPGAGLHVGMYVCTRTEKHVSGSTR